MTTEPQNDHTAAGALRQPVTVLEEANVVCHKLAATKREVNSGNISRIKYFSCFVPCLEGSLLYVNPS